MRYLRLRGEEAIEIDLKVTEGSIVEADIGGKAFRVEMEEVEPGVFWIGHAGLSIEAAVTPSAGGYTVRIGPRQVQVELLDVRERLRVSTGSGGGGTAEVRALMPGRVIEVLVAPGAEVARGQGLFVVEAMKMQNETPSPRAGRVDRLLVQEGVAVNAGDLLATIIVNEDGG